MISCIGFMAAPVFDHTGAIVLAVTAIGPAGIFNTAWDGDIARALKACADTVSQRLGAPASAIPPAASSSRPER